MKWINQHKFNDIVYQKRDEARQAARYLFQDRATSGKIKFVVDRVKQSVEEIPEDSLGKQFLLNAAERLKPSDYIAMLAEVLMLHNMGQPITGTLQHYSD